MDEENNSPSIFPIPPIEDVILMLEETLYCLGEDSAKMRVKREETVRKIGKIQNESARKINSIQEEFDTFEKIFIRLYAAKLRAQGSLSSSVLIAATEVQREKISMMLRKFKLIIGEFESILNVEKRPQLDVIPDELMMARCD